VRKEGPRIASLAGRMKLQPKEIQKLLGKALRDLRLEKSLTQEELADLAGVHPHYISDIERGLRNPAIANLTYLAYALEISTAELLQTAGL
jgi:transcriptional regulator with XRE-family HTH domain